MSKNWLWHSLLGFALMSGLILTGCGTTIIHGTAPIPTTTTPITVIGQATVQGITLTLQSVTANALGTNVRVAIADAQGNGYSPAFGDETVYLAVHGNAYPLDSTLSRIDTELQLTFAPFADADFGKTLTPMLVITAIEADGLNDLTGPWKIPFTVTPVAPRTIIPTQAPVSHNGMGFQVTRVDWVNSATQSGVRVRVHIDNPANVIVNASQFSSNNLNASLGNFVLLQLPAGTSLKPNSYQYGTATVTSGNGDDVSDGTFQGEIDFIYLLPSTPITGQATLHIDAVPTQNAATKQAGQITGPWDLAVPA